MIRIFTAASARFLVSDLLTAADCVHAFGTRDLGPQPGPAHAAIRAAFPAVEKIAGVHQEHAARAVRPGPDTDLAALRRVSADIVVVSHPGLAASVRTADCVPVLVWDPKNRAGAAVHAGWKGTVARAPARAVEILCADHGARVSDLVAAIGPCIGPCHYQVDGPVIAGIEAALGADAGRVLLPDGPGKARLDLSLTNRLILLSAGLDPARIEETRMCTFCHADLFYSYRREGQGVPSLHHFLVAADSLPGAMAAKAD